MNADVLSPVFGAGVVCVALATAGVLSNWLPVATRGRNLPLDGLRGYMAFGVFLYHSVIWYYYVRTGSWGAPPAGLYRPLGDLCVKVFFMITAYLFVGKIIDSRQRPIDWLTLFVSRVLRLTPLYLVAIVALFVMTGILTDWELREPFAELLWQMAQWMTFTMIDGPDINRLRETMVIAGVTWTLAYEWLFYLSLPLLALVLSRRVPTLTVALSTVLLVCLVLVKAKVYFPWSFVVGALAAVVSRAEPIAGRLRGPAVAFAVIAALGWAVFRQDVLLAKVSTLTLMVAFIPIACGNGVFGVLTNRAALLLGEISYGLYLLHSILLTAIFVFLIGANRAKVLSPLQHWATVSGVAITLVVLASVTFRAIEQPAMKSVHRLRNWLFRVGLRCTRGQTAWIK